MSALMLPRGRHGEPARFGRGVWQLLISALALVLAIHAARAQEAAPGAGPGGSGPGVLEGPPGKPVTAPPKVAPANIHAFSGSWMNVKPVVGLIKPGIAPLQPEYEKKLEALAKLAVAGDEVPGNEPRCIPNGPIMDMAFGMRVLVDAEQMTIVTSGPRVRYVWLDGRAHTSDDYLFETYGGESIAHWEGKALVIDTVGLKEGDEIVFGVAAGNTRTHLVERWQLVAPDTLQIRTTIENAEALTKPWTYTRTYKRQPLSNEVTFCTSATDRARNGGFDLTPPAGGFVPPGADQQ